MEQKFFLGLNPRGFHNVAYTQWGQATQRPSVICVHGLTRNGRDFDNLATVLQREAQIFCPDIVGRGKSDWLCDPISYGYPQYLSDMTALIARIDRRDVDWIGTSMGGILGMLVAAQSHTPIRRLVINDVGPFIPLAALKRIGEYVGVPSEFVDVGAVERYMRSIYASFGNLSDANWKHLATYGWRVLPNGKLALSHDPAIAKNFVDVHQDADFWNVYDCIRCPVLVLHGAQSDILSAAVAQEMTRRGPKAKLIEFSAVGHAPALMEVEQIKVVEEFLQA